MAKFEETLMAFCEELKTCIPEVAAAADQAVTKITPEKFWHSWQSLLHILIESSHEELFAKKSGLIVGAVRLTPAIWSELSDGTHIAIWRYLRTLTLEAAMSVSLESVTADVQQQLLSIMMVEKLDNSNAISDIMTQLQERIKSLMGSAGMDVSGITMPEIPERLRNGHIARLAEELAKSINPAELGIDPALLQGDNIEDVLKRLAETYQHNPSILMAGAKRVADKIRLRLEGGSLNRDILIAEAQEFIALFKEHPLFKDAIGKLESVLGEGGLMSMFNSGRGEESERVRAVQERLRKKLEARKAKK